MSGAISRFTRPQYVELAEQRGWNPARVRKEVRDLNALMPSFFTTKIIRGWALDNPFMSDDARAVMMNAARRHNEKPNVLKMKPKPSNAPQPK